MNTRTRSMLAAMLAVLLAAPAAVGQYGSDEPDPARTDEPERGDWRETMKDAPFHANLIRADAVLGTAVTSKNDEKLGEISDVVLDPRMNTISYAVVSSGGVVGVMADRRAIPWHALSFRQDGQSKTGKYGRESGEYGREAGDRDDESQMHGERKAEHAGMGDEDSSPKHGSKHAKHESKHGSKHAKHESKHESKHAGEGPHHGKAADEQIAVALNVAKETFENLETLGEDGWPDHAGDGWAAATGEGGTGDRGADEKHSGEKRYGAGTTGAEVPMEKRKLTSIMHRTVVNRGEKIGETESVIFEAESGSPAYLLVDLEKAVLDLDSDTIAVPWNAVGHGEDQLTLDMEKSKLKEMEFTSGDIEKLKDREYAQAMHERTGCRPYWVTAYIIR